MGNNKVSTESDPIIPYADMDNVPAEIEAPLKQYVERMGFLPNALKLYMHRPELLKCLIRLNNTVMRDESSHLDAELKRRVSILVSALNNSAYCVAHNAATLKKSGDDGGEGWGYSNEDVRSVLDPDGAASDDVEAACMAYARAATLDPSEVPQEVVERIAAVLTPPQVVELACTVGFWKMYNMVHESLYIPLEDALTDEFGENADEHLSEKPSEVKISDVAARVEIYSKSSCPFCRRAKRLLTARGARFSEYDVDGDESIQTEMRHRTGGARTVPQIFINDVLVGGMDQLTALDRVGELMVLLSKSAS